MLSARALAEKSADMPSRISLWPVAPAPASSGKAGLTRRAVMSERASVKHTARAEASLQVPLRLPLLARGEARYLSRAARILALGASISAASETRSNRRMCIGSCNDVPYQLRRVLVCRAAIWLGAASAEAVSHLATNTTGGRNAVICRVPLSAKPIMATAPISMQIAINRPLGSLILANKGPAAWSNGSPLQQRRKCSFLADRPGGHKRWPCAGVLVQGPASHDQDDLSKNLPGSERSRPLPSMPWASSR